MTLNDFSYDFLINRSSVDFEKWFIVPITFEERIDLTKLSLSIKEILKEVKKKINSESYFFKKEENETLKTFINNIDSVYNVNNWIRNFQSEIELNDNSRIQLYELINKIKSSKNLNSSELISKIKDKNNKKHFPHLFSVIKNLQSESEYPVYYKHWQDMYKLISKVKCDYDDLTLFYQKFNVPNKVNKYKAFRASIDMFHVEYLKYAIETNKGYKIIQKLNGLTHNWHKSQEEFINLIYTPMQKMEFINLDKWRVLNETLFNSYINCYVLLESKSETIPAKAMIKALTDNDILKGVKEGTYVSFYTIARELGIFYQDSNENFHLGELSSLYNKGKISYSDYLKHYILNTEFLINDEIVHPFEEIFNSIKDTPKDIDAIVQDCVKLIPISKRGNVASDGLRLFIKRAIEANLIKEENKNYTLAKPKELLLSAISKSNLSKADFTEKFVGTGKDKQENIVKEMINRDIPPILFDGNVPQSNSEKNSGNYKKHPLNQILFGPPGTGKTDSTVEKALEILELKTESRVENREIFRSLLNKRIFFVTMHPSYSYEDFVQGIKPKTSDEGELLFEPKAGIFKQVSKIAFDQSKNIKIAQDPNLKIDFEMVFKFAFQDLIEDGEPVQIKRNGTDFKIIKITDRTLKFETSTGNTAPTYNLSKGTIKKIYDRGNNDIILSGNKGYFDGLLEFLKQKSQELKLLLSKELKDNSNPSNLNYVLILDEINRANISKVFGELITLLEEDKRIGNENEMSVTLPSGEVFSVPSNLYIIGTMNTADKSIALVDIALRRRFQFIPVYPDSTIIETHCKSEDKVEKTAFMLALNKLLRKEKGVDFQIGHAYFLKSNSLSDVINENIIPLLTEYFRNDLEKVSKYMKGLDYGLNEDYYDLTGLLKYTK